MTTNNAKLKALVSLNQDEYNSLLTIFDELITEKMAICTLKEEYRLFKHYENHGNSSLSGSKTKLDFILMYLKENPNQSYHGHLFKISQPKVSE